ncbi:putative ribonuclease H-like domain-containing protein [Tanacetum coccineum]
MKGGLSTEQSKDYVAQGHTQKEGIDYDEVFAPVARIEAIRMFLAYASYMGFMVYQMDVKSAFLYGHIVEDLEKEHLVQDGDAANVDEHLYRSMIGSLMYLTTSKPDIMFAVCACVRFQVSPKISHLLAVKIIFRYLKGKPSLGLWYSKESPLELVAYTDSDYAGATQDRKSPLEAEYVVAANCCGHVLWIQNQLLDYGYNFMNTVIYIDNTNLLTKGFDDSRFQYLVSKLRVKKFEFQVKSGKARKRERVVLFEDDTEVKDDSSKQGRKSDAEVQGKASTETEPIIQEVTPTEVIQDQGSSEKGNSEVSTARATKGTASEVPVISTAEENISTAGRTVTYGRTVTAKENISTARDEEIARQWNEEEEQRVMSEAKSTKKIDWNDPSVIRYHALKMKPKTVAQARRNMIKYLKNQGNYKISDFKGMSYNEIRPIFEKVWDFNQHIEPMEHGSEKMKSPEKIEEEDVDTQKEMKEVSKESGAKRKKSLPRKSTREDVESLSTKYPIVDWKTCVLTENFMYYQIFRGDGSSKNYKVLSEMLEDFDRQDVMDLYRLVKERYSASRPEGYDLMLWGDLHTLFEPDEEDEIWKNQHEYNLISWSLCDFCGIHILLMQNGIAIHMLTEKKYPLSQEMLLKMLSKRLEVDHESTQAYELLKFIRSQVQK